MSITTDRIGNFEIRDNSVASHAERLPYEVYDLAHPNHNYPILVATFANRLDAINYANFVSGEPCFEEDDDDSSDLGPDDSMDGDFDSGMASAGFGTDEDYYQDDPHDGW